MGMNEVNKDENVNSDQEQRFNRMTNTPIEKLILQLSLPSIIAMLITSIYNIADTFFVSQIGTSASAAVGVVFSLMALIQALGFMLGMGAGTYISRLLGQKKQSEASEVASTSFFTSLLFGCLLSMFGIIFLEPLIYALGATPTILPYAKDYAFYILIGAPYMAASYVLNNILRSQGSALQSMIGIGIGGILNVVLDPFFIFVLDLGIGGAALATILSQFASFMLLLMFCFREKGGSQLGLNYFRPNISLYYEILRNGLPSFYRQGLASIATIVLNFSAAPYGDAAIAAMSIVARLMHFLVSTILGFGLGFVPVCAFNYGAKNFDRVHRAFWISIRISASFLAIVGFIFFIKAESLITYFRKEDLAVIAIGTRALRLQCLVLPIQAWIIISSMLTQAIGKTRPSSLIAMSRQGIFFLPIILILPRFIGVLGIQIAQPLADIGTFFFSMFLTLPVLKELKVIKNF
jgi:putative MATE family efflux protein